jgi:hypothetical protein
MWEAIAACASVFMAWISWQKHQREKEEHEAKYRRGERESRSFTFPEIAPSQPRHKHTSFMLTEVDGCLCGLAYWFLWSVLYGAIIDTIFGNTGVNRSLGTILFILWIVLGRYVQTKVHPWLKGK